MKSIYVHKDNRISFIDVPKHYVCVKDGKISVIDERWITINADEDHEGQHILIKENGDIVRGLGGHFKNLKDLGKKKSKTAKAEVVTVDELYEYLKTPEGSLYLKLAHDMGTYNPVKRHETQPTEKEIINNIGGPDQTKGSCASLAIAYAAQRGGMNVIDFKGGKSRDFFSSDGNFRRALQDGLVADRDRTMNGTLTLLRQVQNAPTGKEFILVTGSHAAIVRNSGIDIEYLELQGRRNGWTTLGDLDDKTSVNSMKLILKNRFKTQTGRSLKARRGTSQLYDCDKLMKSKRFQVALGFINTDKDKQLKGAGGGEK